MNSIKLFVFVMISVFAMFAGCSSDSKTLNLSPAVIDFGEVYLDDSGQLDVQITNKYGKAIKIEGLVFSNNSILSFVSGHTLPIDLDKDESHTIRVMFVPDQDGEIDESLSISDDASSKPKIWKITGSGKAVPRMDINAKSQDFQLVLIGNDQTFDFEIENHGTAVMEITSASISGSGSSAYSITAGGSLPVSVAIGQKHTITIKFAPIAETTYDADLSINHDAVDEDNPLIIPITGAGTVVKPEITLNQTSPWDFGAAPTTFAVYKILEMENTGIDDLHVSNVSLTTSAEFTLDHIEDSNGNPLSLPLTVTPGSTAFAYLKFEPKSAIIYNDTLTIEHDGKNQSSPINMSLSGTGKAPQSQSFGYSGNIVSWTVPAGVSTVRIEAWGASGGGPRCGKGARVRGDFIVTPGETLKIIVGENGYVTAQGDYGAGGGGGSYIYRNATDPFPLLVAGGGGGQVSGIYGSDASHTVNAVAGIGNGSGAGGTNGNGGDGGSNINSYSTAGGGAGWLTDGKDGVYVRNPEGKGGQCPKNGAKGGEFTHQTSSWCAGQAGDGGFGGGGSMADNSGAGGGGGGWNGGGGGNNYIGGIWGSGGGAGSYNGGSNKDGSPGVQTGHGKIEITY